MQHLFQLSFMEGETAKYNLIEGFYLKSLY